MSEIPIREPRRFKHLSARQTKFCIGLLSLRGRDSHGIPYPPAWATNCRPFRAHFFCCAKPGGVHGAFTPSDPTRRSRFSIGPNAIFFIQRRVAVYIDRWQAPRMNGRLVFRLRLRRCRRRLRLRLPVGRIDNLSTDRNNRSLNQNPVVFRLSAWLDL